MNLVSILLLVLIAGLCPVQGQNLLSNGSFETAPAQALVGNGYTQNVDNPTTYTVNNWTFGRTTGTGGEPRFHWYSTTNFETWHNVPQNGTYAIQLNSDSLTDFIYVQQSVSVTAGLNYRLSFWSVDETAFDITNPTSVLVNLTGAAVTSQTFTNTLSDVWQNQILNFTAASTGLLTIRFTDQTPAGNTNQNVSLDNIGLFVVPEPSTWLVAIVSALLCVGAARRSLRGHAFSLKFKA